MEHIPFARKRMQAPSRQVQSSVMLRTACSDGVRHSYSVLFHKSVASVSGCTRGARVPRRLGGRESCKGARFRIFTLHVVDTRLSGAPRFVYVFRSLSITMQEAFACSVRVLWAIRRWNSLLLTRHRDGSGGVKPVHTERDKSPVSVAVAQVSVTSP